MAPIKSAPTETSLGLGGAKEDQTVYLCSRINSKEKDRKKGYGILFS